MLQRLFTKTSIIIKLFCVICAHYIVNIRFSGINLINYIYWIFIWFDERNLLEAFPFG